MRKSIFDIASTSINMVDEVDRIITMALEEKNLYYPVGYYSLFDFVDKYCFREWSHRGHFVDVKDFLNAIHFKEIQKNARSGDIDSFMILIELIYNFWQLAYRDVTNKNSVSRWSNNFFHLRNVMLDNLEKYNHTIFVDNDRMLVVEDKAEVTAAVEIVDDNLALDIIRYNHRSLQGDLELKKAILVSLSSELEPRRKELLVQNKQLSEDIFFMLNNLNIRHNNRKKGDKNYKEYVAKMRKDRLEKWYDELYQMILLALLMLDNVDRARKVKQLKGKIAESQAEK